MGMPREEFLALDFYLAMLKSTDALPLSKSDLEQINDCVDVCEHLINWTDEYESEMINKVKYLLNLRSNQSNDVSNNPDLLQKIGSEKEQKSIRKPFQELNSQYNLFFYTEGRDINLGTFIKVRHLISLCQLTVKNEPEKRITEVMRNLWNDRYAEHHTSYPAKSNFPAIQQISEQNPRPVPYNKHIRTRSKISGIFNELYPHSIFFLHNNGVNIPLKTFDEVRVLISQCLHCLSTDSEKSVTARIIYLWNLRYREWCDANQKQLHYPLFHQVNYYNNDNHPNLEDSQEENEFSAQDGRFLRSLRIRPD